MLIPLHLVFSATSTMPRQQVLAVDGERHYQWQEIQQEVAALSLAYGQLPAQRWLLHCQHPLEFLIRLFALLHAGKEVVIPPNFQDGTLQSLAHAFEAHAKELPLDKTRLDALALKPLNPDLRHIHLFTSGSSGQAKCISKSLAEFEREIVILHSLWADAVQDAQVIASVPHHHIYGLLFRLLWPLATGRCFDCHSDALPELLMQAAQRPQRLVLISSPAQLSRLPQLLPLSRLPANLVQIFSSGGSLTPQLAEQYTAAQSQPPIEIYGSTETGGIAWRRQTQNDDRWTAFPGMEIATDQDGALLLKSPILKQPEFYRVEDAIALLPTQPSHQQFQLLGRLDRIVKLEEKRLSLPELEQKLQAHPWVLEAAAIVLQRQRPSLAVVIVLDPQQHAAWQGQDKPGLVQMLRTYLSTYFDPVLLPRYWRFPPALPRSEHGKLSVDNLAQLFNQGAAHAATP